MKQVIFVLLFVLLPCCTMAQQATHKERPQWVDGYYMDKPNSYIEVVSATGYSEDNAREKAMQRIVDNRSHATGRRVKITENNGEISISSNDELTVKCRIIDEYRERTTSGEYRITMLVQTAKNPTFEYEPVRVTDRYPVSARIFVPGMAQIHKGSTKKGIAFIAGEAVAIGGVVAFECLRSSYDSKIGRTHNAAERKDYMNKADNMANLRNGFIAGAAIIYIWNVIDGAVAKGKQHIEVGDVKMNLQPYASLESAGIALRLNF